MLGSDPGQLVAQEADVFDVLRCAGSPVTDGWCSAELSPGVCQDNIPRRRVTKVKTMISTAAAAADWPAAAESPGLCKQ